MNLSFIFKIEKKITTAAKLLFPTNHMVYVLGGAVIFFFFQQNLVFRFGSVLVSGLQQA